MRHERKIDLTRAMPPRYLRASGREKGRLLDEWVVVTGSHRKYARRLVRQGPPCGASAGQRPGRRGQDGPRVVAALQVAAAATGGIGGKRLAAAALPDLVPARERERARARGRGRGRERAREREGALRLGPQERTALVGSRAATMDRKLGVVRTGPRPRGRTTTRPGSLLKRPVAIRPSTPWDEPRPGFVAVDRLAHGGTSGAGDFLDPRDRVEVATGWTAGAALAHRGQEAVFAARHSLRARRPFALLGLDAESGERQRVHPCPAPP